jgi:DNA-binding NarL/FixJ family response regulator
MSRRTPSATRSEEARATLLERETERAALCDALADAAGGRGAVVLVEGPPGIGKTRLLDEAADVAPRLGVSVARARAHELERRVPYAVVRGLLAPALGEAAAAATGVPAAAPADAAAATTRVLGAAPAMPADAEEAAGVVHELYALTASLAQRAPRALLVDDAQWADAASVRFLLYLARRVDGLALALVLGVRAGEAEELVARLLDAAPVRRVRPAALSADAVAVLLREQLGRAPGAALRDACERATGGTPLLIRELARALADAPAEDDAAAVQRVSRLAPEAVTRSVTLRLAAVSEHARRLARAAAIFGDGVRLADAGTLAGLAGEQAAAAAAELAAAALLRDALPLSWRHPLLRAAALAGVPAAERATLHARAARLLDARGADVGLVAAQLLAAEATAEPWATGVLGRAADDARGRGAPDVAVALLRHALAGGGTDPGLRLALARAEIAAGEAAGAAELRAVLAAEPERANRAQLALELGEALMDQHEHREAAAALRAALRDDPGREAGLQLLAMLAVAERYAPGPDDSGAQERLAATAAGLGGATAAERYALAVDAINRPRRTAAELAAAARVVQRAEPDGLLPRAALGGAAVNFVYAYALDEAEAWLARILAELQGRGLPVASTQAATILGSSLRLRGALPAAEAQLREAYNAATAMALGNERISGAELAIVLTDAGRADEAAAVLAACDPPGPVPERMLDNVRLLARARVAEAQHRDDAAIADLLELGRRLRGWGLDRPLPPWRSAAARLLAGRGRREEARRLAHDELTAARRWGGAEVLGIALRGTALVSDPVDVDALAASVAALDAGVARLELARSLVELGAAQRRARRRSAAREPLERGMELAHRCGAAGLAEHARTELRATGARPRRLARTGADALTPSERRVADLAAAGRTNREIAAELYVTPATVETHLRHAFQKLGIHARTDLGTALAPNITAAP